MYFQTKALKVTRYTIPVKNLPNNFNGFTVLQLSDLHSKQFSNNQESLLKTIESQKYDLVAITGDLVDKDNPDIEPAMELVKQLKRKPIYFVPGNHDWWTGFQTKQPLIAEGVHVLENTAEKYSKGNQHIWLMGVDDPYLGKDLLDVALEQVDDSSTKVLLAHAPNILTTASDNKIDLVLVGHTHGGQVRIPLVGAVVVPGQELFPKYDYGIYHSKTTTMIINCGLGESVLPIRFDNKPEIVLVTLKRAQ